MKDYSQISDLEMGKIDGDENGSLPSKEPIELPLITAAKAGSYLKIAEILNKGGDIWEKDEGGRSALHYAAGHENGIQAFESAKILLEKFTSKDECKLYVNNVDMQGRVPLHWAVDKANSEVVEILLKNNCDPTKVDINNESALHIAAKCVRQKERMGIECVKRILESEALKDEQAKAEIINLQSSEVNNSRTALHLAVISGSCELVDYLIQAGADPMILDRLNYNVLHLAIQHGNTEKSVKLVNLLLFERNLGPRRHALLDQADSFTRAPIHLAARLGNAEIVGILVQANANLFQVNQNMNTALHLAASLGNEEKAAQCVEVILNNNSLSEQRNNELVNFSNNNGETALYLAAKNLNTEATKKLLLAGSDYDKRTLKNKSPLEKVYKNVPEALLVILDEAVDRSGYSVRNGVISNYAWIDFEPILGKSTDTKKVYRETEELAKICHAELTQRAPVLNHIFVRIFVWKKWEKIWWCFFLSRLFHILWYAICLVYLMKTYRERCPFKSPKNDTVQFSISAISPPENDDDTKTQQMELNQCNLNGFPKIGGILIIIGSILVLIAEIYPTYQRWQWYYNPLKPWNHATFVKNMKQIFAFTYNVLPISQILIFILVALTSPPLFGIFPLSDPNHFTCIAAFAFTACFCCYLEIGRIPSCRVYINLLKKISYSLFAAIFVHLPILVGFAAVFVFLLQGMPSFSSLPQAIVKVLTLSIGELDYQNVIYEGQLLFKGIEMIAFGIFVIFITVVLINFLVGLATDDVKESRNKRKEIWKICTQIEQIYLLESFLDACGLQIGKYILKNIMLMPPYVPGKQRRQVEILIPSLPKPMQKELHNLNLKRICHDE